ncbi:FecR family protein [Xanthobacteraceae bacterium A53D]
MSEHQADPLFMEALEWFVLLSDGAARPAERAAFQRWLKADPAHAAAFAEAEKLWGRFDVVVPEYARLKSGGGLSRRRAMFGGLALLAAGPALYALSRPALFPDHATAVGERRRITLPDGSMVELGGHSALSLDFSPQERRVHLHAGQGFFEVAADAARPFIVEADGGSARALGTAFDVKIMPDRAVVAVLEHAVEVGAAGARPVVVDAGWQVDYGPAGLRPPQPADLAAVEAWRQDRLTFADVPLRDVIAELERYRRGRILLVGTAVGDIPVTAVFDARRIDAVLPLMAEMLPIRVLNAHGYLAAIYPG